MNARLPFSLALLLFLSGSSLLALSTYLENNHLGLMARHPVWVNLLSGAIGFCFGLLVVSAVLGRMLQRNRRDGLIAAALRVETETRELEHLTEYRDNSGNPPVVVPGVASLIWGVDLTDQHRLMQHMLPRIEQWCMALGACAAAMDEYELRVWNQQLGQSIRNLVRSMNDCSQQILANVEYAHRNYTADAAADLLSLIRDLTLRMQELARTVRNDQRSWLEAPEAGL